MVIKRQLFVRKFLQMLELPHLIPSVKIPINHYSITGDTMNLLEDGYLFWKQFDALRDPEVTLKALIHNSGLNYDLIKVQRSLNRIPKVHEVARLAVCLNVPVEFLIQQTDEISSHQRLRLKIYQDLGNTDSLTLESIKSIVENNICFKKSLIV